MNKFSNLLFVAAAAVLLAAGCAEKEAAPVPIAPILKEIVMPAESSSIPGTTVKIMGKGFDVSDKITCKIFGQTDRRSDLLQKRCLGK